MSTYDEWIYGEIEKISLLSHRVLFYLAKQKQEDTIIRVLEDFTGGTEEVIEQMPPKYADGSFRVRKNGILEYRFKHLDNKIHSTYGKTREICWDKRTALIAGKTTNKRPKELTYGEWLETWFETYKKKNGEASRKSLRYFMDRDIIPALGKIPLNKITGIDLQRLLNKYDDKGNTQTKIANILRGSLRKAYELNKIKTNPFISVDIDTHEAESYKVLEIDEQQLLYENIKNSKYHHLFMFCCCTGLRISEALSVKVEHIDKKYNLIKVVKKQTKTKGGKREVPYLDKLIKDIPQNKEYYFYDITYGGARQYFYKLYKKLEIEATLHSMRHTFISCCYHIGIKAKQIQIWAGHTDIKMTLNTYTHLLGKGTSPVLDYLKELKKTLEI